MSTQTITPTDMVVKVAEIMTIFQKQKRNETDVIDTLHGLLDLVNILDDVDTTFYLNDGNPPIVVPSKGREQSITLNKYAEKILDAWTNLKKQNKDLKYIFLTQLLESSEEVFPTYFDTI